MARVEKCVTLKYPYEASDAVDALNVDIEYPRHRRLKYVRVGLCDVRAADDILIGYDFDRDGYVIHQQRRRRVGGGSEPLDHEQWEEVAFIEAWALEEDAEKPGQ